MPEINHGHHHGEDHIPPPDLPSHEKRILGFRPLHVIIGGVILIVILFIYLLLIARAGY